MGFKPIYDLESLTEEQRQEYYLSACAHYQIPPELNALAFLWLDSGDGKRNLVLYCKKMGSDIIRANKGISITKITKDEGKGYVSWIAEGRDQTGRTEVSIGSASVEGLKGQPLAAAVMLAQTRAVRRLTLQFVGGLLDESELNQTTVDINNAGTSLSSMATAPAPQPVVTPNISAGKDVTVSSTEAPFTDMHITTTEQPKMMVAPEPFANGSIVPEQVESLVQIETEPKKRHRRSKAEMEAARVQNLYPGGAIDLYKGSLDQVNNSASPYCEKHKEAMVLTFYDRPGGPPGNGYSCQSCRMENPIKQAVDTVVTELVEQVAAELMPEAVYPTKEQEDGYRNRLKVYTNDILKSGGMTDGIIWRVRKYTMHLFPDAVIENGKLKLTVKQWDALLEDFDKQKDKPEELVKAINAIAEKA